MRLERRRKIAQVQEQIIQQTSFHDDLAKVGGAQDESTRIRKRCGEIKHIVRVRIPA